MYTANDEAKENFLAHIGTPHEGSIPHSGRYAYGSGDNPFQREVSFRRAVVEMRQKGMSDKEIMQAMGMKTTEFRQMNSIVKDHQRIEQYQDILKLKEQGLSNVEIAEQLGLSGESQVRSLLKAGGESRMDRTNMAADFLRDQLTTKRYLDVGESTERELSDILGYNITAERKDTALKMLEMEGYELVEIRVEQATNKGKFTTMKILAPEGTTKKDIYENLGDVKSIVEYDNETQMTQLGIRPPSSVDSSRVAVRYRDDGGLEKDGVIELRRGVNDLSLGGSNYAQVRIMVDGTHYLKGMAVYADDLPDGVDIMFNTNKASDVPMLGPKDNTVLKPIKKDPANPFGATISAKGQMDYVDENGEKKLSPINKVNEEGGWAEYSKTLSSQFLSKQPQQLIKKQLDLSYAETYGEFQDIMSLTNPAVKKKLLASFAEDCDASAVHLKAAALPRQAIQVLLPLTSVKENEIYAPQFKDGEEVCLVRYPHAGIFEIPQLRVNNKNPEGKNVIGAMAKDAVGISSKVAEQLSGADFDGDTALVIPVSDKIKIAHKKPLEGLVGFDPKIEYKGYPGMKVITPDYKQIQMGVVSNLITDMTLQGAPDSELVRAVKHSMVIIDAEKHELDYRRSYKENGIEELKKTYQPTGGASTLISRSKSPATVEERKIFSIDRDTDPETGEKKYRLTGREYTDKNGVKKIATQDSSKMAETSDARKLISVADTPAERAYADYANKLKALANTARKEYLATPAAPYSKSAEQTYSEEVSSIKAKLNNALKNAPRERQAQITANTVIKMKKKDNPDMDKGEEKKLRQQALSAARTRMGASRRNVQVNLTDREWTAIQAGAISNNLLTRVLDNADMDKVREMAMPKNQQTISSGKEARIKSMMRSGYTAAQIADAVGVSVSTVNKYSKGE